MSGAERFRPLTYLQANAESHPDRAAIFERGQEMSFEQLLVRVWRFMALLQAHGLRAGEVAAVALANVTDYVALEIAVPALGAVIMPLPPALGAHEITSALQRSGATMLISGSNDDVAARVAGESSTVREVLTLPLTLDGLAVPDSLQAARTQPSDVVQIALTSGTTGTPKLAALTAELKQVTFEGFTSRLDIRVDDRVLPLSPITQGAGEMFLYCLRRGACLVMLGEPRFSPDHALRLAQRSRATVLGGVPTMLSRMLDCPALEEIDLKARLCAVAGAPLPPPLAEAWEQRTAVPVASFYGAMDIGQLAVPSPDDPPEKRWHTVGRPHEQAEWAILSPDGAQLAVGEEGEICMRGPLVQQRYWDQRSGPFGDDGWARFGDLGFIDEDGYLHITGRVKDTIIRGGNNINPYEVEQIIRGHPAVSEVAVVGRPDSDLGERPVAFVVIPADGQLDLDALAGFLDERGLARYKWPEALHRVNELPVGPTGKVLRDQLRERAANDHTPDRK
jgi:acyl-CoA synthetase (AMP-forming)/AMP-acid ligase II